MTSVWMMVSDLREEEEEEDEFVEEVTGISGFNSRNGIRRAAPGASRTFCEGVIVRPGSGYADFLPGDGLSPCCSVFDREVQEIAVAIAELRDDRSQRAVCADFIERTRN